MGVRDDHEAWSREGDPMDAMHKANRTRIEKLPAPPTWRPLLGDVKAETPQQEAPRVKRSRGITP